MEGFTFFHSQYLQYSIDNPWPINNWHTGPAAALPEIGASTSTSWDTELPPTPTTTERKINKKSLRKSYGGHLTQLTWDRGSLRCKTFSAKDGIGPGKAGWASWQP